MHGVQEDGGDPVVAVQHDRQGDHRTRDAGQREQRATGRVEDRRVGQAEVVGEIRSGVPGVSHVNPEELHALARRRVGDPDQVERPQTGTAHTTSPRR